MSAVPPGARGEFVRSEISFQFFYSGTSDERLKQAIHRLHERPLHGSFPWEELTRETGLSRRHIDRLLCAEFGMTAQNYWARLKEEAAARLLETTSFSIKEIGFQLGFKQASHFTKWFSLRAGWSPRRHRQLGARAEAEGRVKQADE
ncbi:MAG: helix-turn-helix domain-containing protein [Terrimicrobiaceae bacterium]